jgi:type I restriction enzyme S subunit
MGDRRFKFQELRDQGVLDFGDGYRAKNSELDGGGPIFLRAAYLQDDGFILNDPDRFKEMSTDKFGPKVAQLGDVVITTKGNSTGRIGVIREPETGSVYSPHLSYWRSLDRELLDQQYLYYWSRSVDFRQQLYGLAYATDMAPYLSLRDQATLTLPIPPIEKQRMAAAILGALDDKIELNRRMNETLEAMARAIFKDWFVDFGPTRAKAEGRPPYLAADLWNLFPDVLDDEDKPVGWELSEIGKEVEAVGGATPSTKEPAFWDGGGHHWATPKDLSKLASPVLLDTDRRITDAGLKKISSGLLPVGTVLLSSRAPIGYLTIAEVPTAVNQGFIAMVCRKRLSNVFVLFWCYENLDYIKGISGGSTFAEISKKAFRPVPVVVPSDQALAAYEGLVRPLYDRIVANTREAASLAKTRDLLLPTLMSGKIRLAEAEKAVEAVA